MTYNELSSRLYRAMNEPTLMVEKPYSKLHPSSASVVVKDESRGDYVLGTCLREQYYRLTQEVFAGSRNLDWELSARAGDFMELLIEDLLNTHGFAMGIQILAKQHPLYQPELNLSGRTDNLIWDYARNEPAGIDVKSVGEWKSGEVLEEPDPKHVMQCLIYLDHYQKSIPKGQARPTRWYIWYVARSESYKIKSRKHGSPFTILWDFSIEIQDGYAVVHCAKGTLHWKHINIASIQDRYRQLLRHLRDKVIPDRDYILNYSEEKILGLYKQGLIEYKKDQKPIEEWVSKGAPPGKLELQLGDWECKMCPFQTLCWNLDTLGEVSNKPFNLPATIRNIEPSIEI